MPLLENVKLQKHQQDALDKSHGKGGIIVNHGLGSGKTLTSMAIAEHRGGKVLAVVPASLRGNYKEQLNKFVPKERHGDYKIISYNEFAKDPHKHIDEHQPNTMIADEVHRLRNPNSLRKSFEQTRGRVPFMVGMTGSLVNNHPTEAVGLINLVNGKKVMSHEEFARDHIGIKTVKPSLLGKLRGIKPGQVEVITNEKALKKKLSPYIHKFDGDAEYKSNLPSATYSDVKVNLSKRQQDMIAGLAETNKALAYKLKHNLPPSKQEATQLNAFMMGMRQASNNPAALDKTIENGVEHSPKMKAAIDSMHEKMKGDPNFRGAVYSKFLNAGVRPLAEELGGNVYEGSLNDKNKKKTLDEFAKGEKKVLGISPSGGEGLDLKGVKLMQILEPDWNPETTSQAIGRAIRYKSHAHLPENERNVKVERYIATHPDSFKYKIPFVKKPTSPDEYIQSRANEKQRLNNQFMGALKG